MPPEGERVRATPSKLSRVVEPSSRSVAEIRWRGGPLENAHYDEFVIAAKLADGLDAPVAFEVLQQCERGRNDWSGAPGTESPAPRLQVEPVRPAAHSH